MEIMQAGRLDYAYRLTAARLAILRLRLARHRQRLLQRSSSSASTGMLQGLAAVCVISGFAWLGFQAGQRMGGDPVVLTDSLLTAPSSQITGQSYPGTPVTERQTAVTPAAAAALIVPATSEPEQVDYREAESEKAESEQGESEKGESRQANAIDSSEVGSRQTERHAKVNRVAELASLRKTVGELQTQVQMLEQEATGLEIELLEQQIAFARAEEQWKEASVERRVVYNFTNIPVGGSVSEERIASDAEQADFSASENDFNEQAQNVYHDTDPNQPYSDISESVEPWIEDDHLADDLEHDFLDPNARYVDQIDGSYNRAAEGSAGRYSSAEPSLSSNLSVDEHTRQEVFFGPATDRFNDWNN